MDLLGWDLSGLNVSDRIADLLQADFDSRTRWPAVLPAPFDPQAIMDLGRNPGLGVRSLHERGITGKGVGVAVIDRALLVEHEEYADRLRYYEEIHCLEDTADMHGVAVASIAVGWTVGVAPGADLYYIAETHGTYSPSKFNWDLTYLAQSIDRILEVNDLLPDGAKIRVISISAGWIGGQRGADAADSAVRRAKKAGIFVISSRLDNTHGLRFHGLERDPLADPEASASYRPISGWGYYSAQYPGAGVRDILCVPMNSRTAAAPDGPDEYAFYRTGWWSWCAPYLAGLYALACQVDPDITPDKFWSTALDTGQSIDLSVHEEGCRAVIVQPVRLIEALESGS